jgi:hypothetical protein
VLFEMKGVLGALDERTKQQSERLGKIESRLWWVIGLLVAALLGIALRR